MMRHGLVRRVRRLEEAKRATDTPYVQVIELDEHGHPTHPLAARPDGRPIPVIIMPRVQSSATEDVQILAIPENLHQRSQH
jgi:hypothetical protein